MPAFDYEAEKDRLKRRRAVSDAMLTQSMQPMGGTEYASGIAVRRSPLEGIAKLAQSYFATQQGKKLDDEQIALAERNRTEIANAIADYSKATTAAPESWTGEAGDELYRPAVTPTQNDRQNAAMTLMGRVGDPKDAAKMMVADALKPKEIKAYKPGDVLYQDGRRVGAIPKEKDPFTLSPGARRYNPDGSEMVVAPNAPAAPTELSRLQSERAALPDGDPRAAQYDAAIRKATTHTPAASANVTIKQEGEEAKTVGKGFGEQYVNLQQGAMSAQSKLNNLDRMEQLMQGVNTGALVPTVAQVAGIARTMGFNIDPNLGAKQAVEALSNEMALALRNPSGGAGMPGAMSDKDREFLVQMTPGLAKTPEGNALMIQTARKLAKRDMEVANIARDYRQKNGQLNEGFYNQLAQWSAQNPLFSAPNAGGNPAVDAALRKYQ